MQLLGAAVYSLKQYVGLLLSAYQKDEGPPEPLFYYGFDAQTPLTVVDYKVLLRYESLR